MTSIEISTFLLKPLLLDDFFLLKSLHLITTFGRLFLLKSLHLITFLLKSLLLDDFFY